MVFVFKHILLVVGGVLERYFERPGCFDSDSKVLFGRAGDGFGLECPHHDHDVEYGVRRNGNGLVASLDGREHILFCEILTGVVMTGGRDIDSFYPAFLPKRDCQVPAPACDLNDRACYSWPCFRG